MSALNNLKQHLMLPQFTFGLIEAAFNALLKRSPHIEPNLRKLVGKVLKIELTSPKMDFFILFSENRTDWLGSYEGEADCAVTLAFETLPKLADKQKLTELINNKSLVLNGDIQVLQHFTALLEQLEKDPAELLSPFVGDVVAQTSTDFAKKLFGKVKSQFEQNNQHLVENLMQERPVLVHRLQAVNFYDQVEELAQQAVKLEQKFAKLGIR
ncbi:SCP2 sterol-binding domain-containing protein [Mannheimia sp. AT1]|uniref:Ubiquinone biosynthesis accessory factor UbiJ n=1 Tax=Mannheimia cairinae TaxID=3025936 RepID=A0ABT5MMH4_9PAST|nr:SCP2 sterol-binding domain-containing protein [Mannheimia cairinae]MDD0823377.1 SCP2 sterol-binding domain-containing protein [Mannheimia cairinae]MDD0827015.1 SCP2 sterol-binding domain-containing protein [Mannheimia cairinae]